MQLSNKFWRPTGRYIFYALIFVLFIVSCGKKGEKRCDHPVALHDGDVDLARLAQAKYADIPLPVGYTFVDCNRARLLNPVDDEKSEDDSDFFCYKGNMVFDQVLQYYRKNMERLGWKITDISNAREGLLFCEKIQRTCVISLRNKRQHATNKNYICLFVKNKGLKKRGVVDINSKHINTINVFAKDTILQG